MNKLAYVLVSTLSLSACISGVKTDHVPLHEDNLLLNPYDRIGNRPEVLLTAQLKGRLTFDGKCLQVTGTNSSVTPLWPEGTKVENSENEKRLILPDNRGSAKIGSTVSIGGAAFLDEQSAQLPANPERCPRPFFGVSTAD